MSALNQHPAYCTSCDMTRPAGHGVLKRAGQGWVTSCAARPQVLCERCGAGSAHFALATYRCLGARGGCDVADHCRGVPREQGGIHARCLDTRACLERQAQEGPE